MAYVPITVFPAPSLSFNSGSTLHVTQSTLLLAENPAEIPCPSRPSRSAAPENLGHAPTVAFVHQRDVETSILIVVVSYSSYSAAAPVVVVVVRRFVSSSSAAAAAFDAAGTEYTSVDCGFHVRKLSQSRQADSILSVVASYLYSYSYSYSYSY